VCERGPTPPGDDGSAAHAREASSANLRKSCHSFWTRIIRTPRTMRTLYLLLPTRYSCARRSRRSLSAARKGGGGSVGTHALGAVRVLVLLLAKLDALDAARDAGVVVVDFSHGSVDLIAL
jgi:hypothetical protein